MDEWLTREVRIRKEYVKGCNGIALMVDKMREID